MKTPRQASSVYRNQNALIRAVFERAGDPRKVLCVALDYAKRKHLALVCDGRGDILKTAFPVENNTAGLNYLIEQISAAARRYLRLLRSLALNEVPYLHPQGRARCAPADDIAAAALETWAVLQRKWRTIPGGMDRRLFHPVPLRLAIGG